MDDIETPLFRSAAVAAQRHDGRGSVVLARPASFAVLGTLCAAVAVAVLSFGYFASYTAHSRLVGRLVPEAGVLEVTSPQGGVIVAKRVGEGERVAAGQVLFVVSSERLTGSGTATQAAIGTQLVRRRRSLETQIASTAQLEKAEQASLAERLAASGREAESIDAVLEAARARLALASTARERYARMRALGFLAEEQWSLREAELLEQHARVKTLERERAAVARTTAELAGRAAALELTFANERAELERAVAATELEIVDNDARRSSVVVAPAAGVVTGVAAEAGQPLTPGAVLARVVPSSSKLVAELYAPSRAVGFIAAGDEVLLRYAAFPYQKFGHARGVVAAVSRATLAPELLPMRLGARAEPVYLVTVTLESQAMSAYGEPRALLPDMEVEADVLRETRRLYEWVLEPLYALASKAR
jgi:membrane fusion protein